jgi:hypothetical protein
MSTGSDDFRAFQQLNRLHAQLSLICPDKGCSGSAGCLDVQGIAVNQFACGDMKQPRLWVIAALTMVLIVAVWLSWQWLWRRLAEKPDDGATVLRADLGYWISMFTAGTLGTVIGDYCSHDLHLGDAGASILLSPLLGVLFFVGRNGPLRWLWFYWLTVVMVRAAGTAVGDLVSGRNMLGLPLSTFVTGTLFVALLVIWKQRRGSEPVVQRT